MGRDGPAVLRAWAVRRERVLRLRIPAALRCSCAPGYEMVDRRDWGKGCKPMSSVPNCSQGGAPEQRLKFVRMPHTDFYGYDLGYNKSVTFEYCKKICLDMCLCSASSYRIDGTGLYFPEFVLFNGFRSSAFPASIYLKVPFDFNVTGERNTADGLDCDPNDEPQIVSPDTLFATPRNSTKWSYFFVFAGILGVLDLLFVVTGNFEELERGGSGVVYRGVLYGGKKVVALKKLTNTQGDDEF